MDKTDKALNYESWGFFTFVSKVLFGELRAGS